MASAVEPRTMEGTSESTPLLGNGGRAGIKKGSKIPGMKPGTCRIVGASLIAALVLLGVFWPGAKSSSTAELCLTPTCIHAASTYLSNLSPEYKTLDPCTDFEEIVCGGFRENNDLRADQGRVDTLSLVDDVGTSTLRHILEGAYPGSSQHSSFSPLNLAASLVSADQENFDTMQKAYKACMDVDAITKRGIAPLSKLVEGLASILADTSDAKADYADAILYLEQKGATAFFEFYAGDDAKNPEVTVISISPRRAFGLPSKEYFADEKIVAQYQAAMASVLGALNLTVPSVGTAADTAAAVLKLESQLTQIGPENADMFDVTKTYNQLAVKDVAQLMPQFGLEKVLRSLVPKDYTVDTTITAFPETLANVSQIVAHTPKDVVKTFLYWRLVTAYSTAVLGPEIEPLHQFANILQGKDPNAQPERWRTCVRHVDSKLAWVLSRFFVEAAFSAAAKDFGNQIILDIKEAYLKNFKKLDWMDDKVKKVAAEKVHNIDQKIGYPSASPNIMDPEELKQYYANLQIGDDYFGNVLAGNQFDIKRGWSVLGKPTDMKEWGMSVSTVNAYYNPTHNEIVFPAAIMQQPLFSVDLPSYISYGAFGSVAGHELSHAFDNNGRHYDVHGRYDNWWTNSTIDAFTDRAQCIIDEFDNFTVPGTDGPIHIKGRQTLGENIADSGGISAAWSAWNARRKNSTTPELSLPGLEFFTHEQLFFVSFSNSWCSKFRTATLTNQVITNEHSPGPIRVKGTLQNSRAFREVFNCPVKEPTCELW